MQHMYAMSSGPYQVYPPVNAPVAPVRVPSITGPKTQNHCTGHKKAQHKHTATDVV
jgi:hypothetical protein